MHVQLSSAGWYLMLCHNPGSKFSLSYRESKLKVDSEPCCPVTGNQDQICPHDNLAGPDLLHTYLRLAGVLITINHDYALQRPSRRSVLL